MVLKYRGFEFYIVGGCVLWACIGVLIANLLLLLCFDADEGSENKWNEKKKISYHLYLEIRRERENKIEIYFLSYVCVAKRNEMERIMYFFT